MQDCDRRPKKCLYKASTTKNKKFTLKCKISNCRMDNNLKKKGSIEKKKQTVVKYCIKHCKRKTPQRKSQHATSRQHF